MFIDTLKEEASEENFIVNNETIVAILKTKERMRFSVPIMKRLFETFIDSSYISTQELLNAVEKNDMALVKLNAHGIRGSALSLNFNDIAALCKLLEYEENINPERDDLSIAKELKKKIDQMYHAKNTILANLTELE